MASQDKTELDSKSTEESSISDKTKACEESSKAKEERQKSVAYEYFPAAYDFFVPKESAKVNCELKEETKAFEESSKVEKEPQKSVAYENCEPEGFVKVNYKLIAKTKASVAYEFFEPKESNSNKTLLYYKNNSKLKPKSKAYKESSNAEEKPQNLMAYEFIEPKVSAPINSKLKANLRAKFEMNQINRGRIPQNRHSAIL